METAARPAGRRLERLDVVVVEGLRCAGPAQKDDADRAACRDQRGDE